jgi:hypothetical protein
MRRRYEATPQQSTTLFAKQPAFYRSILTSQLTQRQVPDKLHQMRPKVPICSKKALKATKIGEFDLKNGWF